MPYFFIHSSYNLHAKKFRVTLLLKHFIFIFKFNSFENFIQQYYVYTVYPSFFKWKFMNSLLLLYLWYVFYYMHTACWFHLVSLIYTYVFRADNLESDNYLGACPRRRLILLSPQPLIVYSSPWDPGKFLPSISACQLVLSFCRSCEGSRIGEVSQVETCLEDTT